MGEIKRKSFLCFLILVIFSFSGCGLLEISRYILTIEINNEDGGSVLIDPNLPEYIRGTSVSLEAQPQEGWYFKEWKKDGEGNEHKIQVVMNSHKIFLAEFDIEPEEIGEIALEIFSAFETTLTHGNDEIEPFLAENIFHHTDHNKEDYLNRLKSIASNEDHNITFWDVSYQYQVGKIVISGMCEEITLDGTFTGGFEILVKEENGDWKMYAFYPEEGIMPLSDKNKLNLF